MTTTNLNIGAQTAIFTTIINGKEVCFHNGGNGFGMTHSKGTNWFDSESEFNTYLQQAKDATK